MSEDKFDTGNLFEKNASDLAGMKYSKIYYDIFFDKSNFTKNQLYNFLMISPDVSPSMLKTDKSKLAELAALIFSNKNLLENWYNHLSQSNRDFLFEITRNGYISTDYAVKKFQIQLKKKDYYYLSNYIDYSCEEYPFSYFFTYSKIFVAINPVIRGMLTSTLDELAIPKDFIEEDELKSKRFYFSEENGSEFFENLHEILHMLQNENFFARPSNRPLIKAHREAINSLAEITPFASAGELVADFQIESKKADDIQRLRLDIFLKMIATAYTDGLSYTDEPDFNDYDMEPKKFFRNLVRRFLGNHNAYFEYSYIFPQFSIANKNRLSYAFGDVKDEQTNLILNYFRRWRYEKPVSFETLEKDGIPYFLVTSSDMWLNFKPSEGDEPDYFVGTERIYLTGALNYYLFYVPVFNNLLLTFAALGFFEISWNPEKEEPGMPCLYPFGKIEYIQMTPLGKYVFGVADDVEIKTAKKVNPIVLNPQMQIINCPEDNRVAQRTLNEFCERLSDTVFCFSQDKFHRKAKTAQKIGVYFELLKNLSGEKLPQYWRDLKDKMMTSVCSMEYDDSWVLIKIPLDNKKFLSAIENLMKQTPDHILKVQGGRIAVKKNMLNMFEYRLKNMGIQIEEK